MTKEDIKYYYHNNKNSLSYWFWCSILVLSMLTVLVGVASGFLDKSNFGLSWIPVGIAGSFTIRAANRLKKRSGGVAFGNYHELSVSGNMCSVAGLSFSRSDLVSFSKSSQSGKGFIILTLGLKSGAFVDRVSYSCDSLYLVDSGQRISDIETIFNQLSRNQTLEEHNH